MAGPNKISDQVTKHYMHGHIVVTAAVLFRGIKRPRKFWLFTCTELPSSSDNRPLGTGLVLAQHVPTPTRTYPTPATPNMNAPQPMRQRQGLPLPLVMLLGSYNHSAALVVIAFMRSA